jgi:hypothetical protein
MPRVFGAVSLSAPRLATLSYKPFLCLGILTMGSWRVLARTTFPSGSPQKSLSSLVSVAAYLARRCVFMAVYYVACVWCLTHRILCFRKNGVPGSRRRRRLLIWSRTPHYSISTVGPIGGFLSESLKR